MIRALSLFSASGLVVSALVLGGCEGAKATTLNPDGGSQLTAPDAGGSIDNAEKASLEEIATAMRNFHTDTTGWPYGDTAWRFDDDTGLVVPQPDPAEFTDNDVALFKQAKLKGEVLPSCEDRKTDPCWKGPYSLAGNNMIDQGLLDKWGHKRFLLILRPKDGFGGTPSKPDGAVVIWSSGPDGLDQTGCIRNDVGLDPACGSAGSGYDFKKIASGQSSVPGDDVIVVVSNSSR